jgi:16S rRNA (guanine527-N7)-methyltransferase
VLPHPPALPDLPDLPDLWLSLGWQPSSSQQAQYQALYQAILQGNQQLNLTRITAPDEFLEKHLWDSLRGIQPWLEAEPQPLRLIDIGTGAGFPGVPIAIACPTWRVVLLDSTRKKIAFLDRLAAELNLPLQTVVERAEQIGHLPDHRAAYDLATVRAVAAARVCAEYALPLLRLGGVAVLYRGQPEDESQQTLQAAVAQLGGEIQQIDEFVTPMSQSARHCIYLKKIAPTPPAFPRPVGVPNQNPL